MTRHEFYKEFERIQQRYDCKIYLSISENISIYGDIEKIEEIRLDHASTLDDDGYYDELISCNETFEEYDRLALYLNYATLNRKRNIFNDSLYEEIAEHFVEYDGLTREFDRKTGHYHVLVSKESKGYGAGCSAMEEGWEEVDSNFDSEKLEQAIERLKEKRETENESRKYTESMLRKIA